MPKDRGISGNALETANLEQKKSLSLAREIELLSAYYSVDGNGAFDIISLRFRAPDEKSGEWLGVATILQEGERLVGFSSALTLAGCIELIGRRIRLGSMKWRPDEYAGRG